MKVVVDLDRVVADTNSLKDDAMRACVEAGVCTEEEYKKEYAAWSAEVRNTDHIADLPLEEQKSKVSWIEGFVSQLAHATGADETMLRGIHRDALTRVKPFAGVIELLKRISKNDLYIVTAGGDIDQNLKLHALGIGDVVLHDHIAIVPAKDKETFKTLFDYWKFTESERIIHINARAEEFTEQILAHERTICIQPLWGWARKDRYEAPNAPPHYDVETVRECAIVLEHQMSLPEGALYPMGEILGKVGM